MTQQSKIYVGNLPYEINEDGLRDMFVKYGDIAEVKLIKDQATGRSKGFAFITFDQDSAAKSALESDGTEIQSRRIKVSAAREDRAGGGGRRGGGGGGFRGGNGGGNSRQRW
ncbi:MAG: RNA recognition motif domain-containing protein [Gammaproteobacteria bacterium]